MMPRKQNFQVTANYQTAAIVYAIGSALLELTSGGTTRAASFERLVQQYTGKRFSLEEIRAVMNRPISDYIKPEAADVNT